ncbi:MAG: divergent polysaccharide deacetylase family protein [Gammaproteobacteria bacterium]|nr:divergent polysaccharide deacetylase family protein [Gammaproteobacteria bacterium]
MALIIDDIGNDLAHGRGAVELPGPLACAFLPHTPHAASLARLAGARGKEVLLHQPMEARGSNHLLGPGALRLDMPADDMRRVLSDNLSAVPGAVGLNGHMGSAFTSEKRAMATLMHLISARRGAGPGLYFVDSRTTTGSVARPSAALYEVPFIQRDVFLDNDRDIQAITDQLEALRRIAHQRGYAVGIGHPHPETLAVLREALPELASRYGLELVSVEALIERTRLSRARQTLARPPRPGPVTMH